MREPEDVVHGVRPPAVAGTFYPRQAEALRAAIAEAFRSPLGPGAVPAVASTTGDRRLVGIVAPHAGYVYSAAGAAWAFAEAARAGRPEAVVLLGVNHRGYGAPLAVSPARGWETPLGVAPVAADLRACLLALDAGVTPDGRAHAQEHSLEVQVPFIQSLFGDVPILPIAIGSAADDTVQGLGLALAKLIGDAPILIVASTDFSHYLAAAEAARLDALALAQIVAVNPAGLLRTVRAHNISMCGKLPVAALLTAARQYDGATGRQLAYFSSGDVTGDSREVVGYGAAAVWAAR